MIHILFGAAAAGSFKFSLKEMEFDKKERVISFSDIFSIGPIWKLHKGIGVKSRFDWIRKCMNDTFGEYPAYTGDFNKALHQISSIPDGEHVMIWASDSAHEQTGLRFVAYLLKEKNIDMTVVNTTKEYDKLFQIKKIKYTLLHTGEIPPEKFREIYERGDGIFLTDHDRERLEKDWLLLAESSGTLRIWRNGRIKHVSEDYYDYFIIKRAKKLHGKREFIKSVRLIGEALGYLDQYVVDTFIEYRLKILMETGIFEFEGSLEAMHLYSVRLKDL